MTDPERAELIAALHQTTSLAESLLGVNQPLVRVLFSGEGASVGSRPWRRSKISSMTTSTRLCRGSWLSVRHN